jgi:hypothetical protein
MGQPGERFLTVIEKSMGSCHLYWSMLIDLVYLIDVQSSNRRPILKYMVVFHFLKSTFNYVTDVYFKWRHTRYDMVLKQWRRRDNTRFRVLCTSTLADPNPNHNFFYGKLWSCKRVYIYMRVWKGRRFENILKLDHWTPIWGLDVD